MKEKKENLNPVSRGNTLDLVVYSVLPACSSEAPFLCPAWPRADLSSSWSKCNSLRSGSASWLQTWPEHRFYAEINPGPRAQSLEFTVSHHSNSQHPSLIQPSSSCLGWRGIYLKQNQQLHFVDTFKQKTHRQQNTATNNFSFVEGISQGKPRNFFTVLLVSRGGDAGQKNP